MVEIVTEEIPVPSIIESYQLPNGILADSPAPLVYGAKAYVPISWTLREINSFLCLDLGMDTHKWTLRSRKEIGGVLAEIVSMDVEPRINLNSSANTLQPWQIIACLDTYFVSVGKLPKRPRAHSLWASLGNIISKWF